MIYLHRYTNTAVEIAVVEEAGHAERYEARGYRRCDYEAFRADWQMRDAAALAELWVGLVPPVVVETAPIKGEVWVVGIGKLFKH